MKSLLLLSALAALLVLAFAGSAFAQEPTIWTTRAGDYAPGETVPVEGAFFAPLTAYDIFVIRPDGTIVKSDGATPGLDSVTSDVTGSFTYPYYLLDGIRGAYEVRIYPAGSCSLVGSEVITPDSPIATTIFWDAIGFDFTQVLNDDRASGYALGELSWANGIINSQPTGHNSVYYEGMAIPQRLFVMDVPDKIVGGNEVPDTHVMQFAVSTTKDKGVHAYDFITSYDQAIEVAKYFATTQLDVTFKGVPDYRLLPPRASVATDAVSILGKAIDKATLAVGQDDLLQAWPSVANPSGTGWWPDTGRYRDAQHVDVPIPDDPYVSDSFSGPTGITGAVQDRIDAFEELYGNRTVRIYYDGAPGALNIDNIELYHSADKGGAVPITSDMNYDSTTSDTFLQIRITWTGTTDNMLVLWAGHLAQSGQWSGTSPRGRLNWGPSLGAGSINGGPYHFALVYMDGGVGNRDNQIKAGGILIPNVNLSGHKYEDMNANGIYDGTDTPLQFWRVYLDLDNDKVWDDLTEPVATTDANGLWTIPNVAPGSYTVRELAPVGADPSAWYGSPPMGGNPPGVNAVDPVGSLTPFANEQRFWTVTVGTTDVTGIDFFNYMTASKSGHKYEDMDADGDISEDTAHPLEGWKIYADLNGNNVFDTGEPFDETDANGAYSITGLTPGDYSFREVLKDGWTQSYPATGEWNVTLSSREADTGNDFGNWAPGTKSGYKFFDGNMNGTKDSGEAGMDNWTINAYVDTDKDGVLDPDETTIAKTAITGADAWADGYYQLSLDPGFYIVKEVQKSGWTQSAPASGFYPVEMVSRGSHPNNHFGNWRPLEVWKTIKGMAPGLHPDWPNPEPITFQIRSGASPTDVGTILASGQATVANGGHIEFKVDGSWLYLVPGNTYQLVEIVPLGYTPSLLSVPTWFRPNSVNDPLGDNSAVAVNFTVPETGAITYPTGTSNPQTVDNKPPNMARTPGFWKNWSSVTGGGQKYVLDETLASAVEPGIYIGDLLLSNNVSSTNPTIAVDAMNAYRLLDKRTINTGAKMASDPAFNLACMLTAYRLNVLSGSVGYANVETAAQWAQYYLAQADFNGITHKPLPAELAANMNYLAGVIDKYNNMILSPTADVIMPYAPVPGVVTNKKVYSPAVPPPLTDYPFNATVVKPPKKTGGSTSIRMISID